jgi:hypothetical protein
LYSGLIPEAALSTGKAKVGKSTAIETIKMTRLKLLLLCFSHQPQFYQPARCFRASGVICCCFAEAQYHRECKPWHRPRVFHGGTRRGPETLDGLSLGLF